MTGTAPFILGVDVGDRARRRHASKCPGHGRPDRRRLGRFTGYLSRHRRGHRQGPVTRTSLGMIKEDERYDLTVELRDRQGNPANSYVVVNKAGDFLPYVLSVEGDTTVRLPAGTYTVEADIDVNGEQADALGLAVLADPEIILDRTTEVVLDARQARQLQTEAPQRTEDRQTKDRLPGHVRGRFLVPQRLRPSGDVRRPVRAADRRR